MSSGLMAASVLGCGIGVSRAEDPASAPGDPPEEAAAALTEFARAYPNLKCTDPDHGNIHAVGFVGADENTPSYIRVLTYRAPTSADKPKDDDFEYMYPPAGFRGPRTKKTVRVRVRREQPMEAHAAARSGDNAARSFNSPIIGTAGWNIRFGDEFCCVVCWHVMCPDWNNAPVPGAQVVLHDTACGTLKCNQRIYFDGRDNTWDLALIKFPNDNCPRGSFKPCQHSLGHKYPLALTPRGTMEKGKPFRKIGDRTGCTSATYRGRENRSIRFSSNFPYGRYAVFANQLLFGSMGEAGDSGSLVVRESDDTLAGLYMAGNSTESLANPLLDLPWIFDGPWPDATNPVFPKYHPTFPETDPNTQRCWLDEATTRHEH